jgi:hypothetical protein
MFGESQRCARWMHVPSRGSEHVASFTRYTAARQAYWRSRMLGAKPASASVNVAATFGSLAPPKKSHPYRILYLLVDRNK